jgi:hypothetical protein
MPKIAPTALACVLAVALAGCGPTNKQAPAPSESLVPLPSAQPAPPAPGPATGTPGTDAAATASPPASPEPEADACGAGKLGRYLNLLPTSDAMDAIRKAVGHERIRAINPGDAVTMDMRPDRLNIEIGEDGRIKHFRCY